MAQLDDGVRTVDGTEITPDMLSAGGLIPAAEMVDLTLSQIAAVEGLPVEILTAAIDRVIEIEAASHKAAGAAERTAGEIKAAGGSLGDGVKVVPGAVII